jgi:hypothetical protein
VRDARVRLALALDGRVEAPRALELRAVAPALLVSLAPSTISERGGVRLALRGSGFAAAPGLACRFRAQVLAPRPTAREAGAALPPPVTASAQIFRRAEEAGDVEEIGCAAPALLPGRWLLDVSLNGEEFSDAALALEVLPAPTVLALVPRVGPRTGGTLISLLGRGFSRSSALACVFGGALRVPATYVSPTEVRCRAPALAAADDFEIEEADGAVRLGNATRATPALRGLAPPAARRAAGVERVVGIELAIGPGDATDSGLVFE